VRRSKRTSFVNLENCVDRIGFVCVVYDAIDRDLILASDVVDKLWTVRDTVCAVATRAKNYDVNNGNDQSHSVNQIEEFEVDFVGNVNNDAMLNECVTVENVEKKAINGFTERGKIARDEAVR
jgi:hypothetical protein